MMSEPPPSVSQPASFRTTDTILRTSNPLQRVLPPDLYIPLTDPHLPPAFPMSPYGNLLAEQTPSNIPTGVSWLDPPTGHICVNSLHQHPGDQCKAVS